MKYSLILIVLIVSFSSCDILRLFTIEEQNDENISEISDYLESKNIKFDYLLLLNDSMTEFLGDTLHSVDGREDPSAIQLRIYDKSGNLYSGFTQCNGDFRFKRFLGREYPPAINSHPYINYNLKLKSEFKLWEISEEKENEIIKNTQNSDYTFVVYWNIWTGGFSKKVLKEVTRYNRKFKNKKMLVLLVNNAKNQSSSL